MEVHDDQEAINVMYLGGIPIVVHCINNMGVPMLP